jgi:hypothetical protein
LEYLFDSIPPPAVVVASASMAAQITDRIVVPLHQRRLNIALTLLQTCRHCPPSHDEQEAEIDYL